MNPLFNALDQRPVEARMHAETEEKKSNLVSTLVRGVSFISGGKIKKLVTSEVVPSVGFTKKELDKFEKQATKELAKRVDIQRSKFTAEDQTTLDRVALSSNSKPMSERKIIVYFLPNYELWQNMIDLFDGIRTQLGADIICSNYRGSGKSTGFPNGDEMLINDGLLQVQQLLDQGAKPENIALFGYSLGGGVATAVAASLEDHKISVNLINERSFRSLSAVIRSADQFGKEVAAVSVKSLGWKLPSETNLEKLNGNIVIIHNDHDEVIEYKASLKGAVDSKEYTNKRKMTFVPMKKTPHESPHNRSWSKNEELAIMAAIKSSFNW